MNTLDMLAVNAACMCLLTLFTRRAIKLKTVHIMSVVVISTYVMIAAAILFYYIENGVMGLRAYGAPLVAPIVMYLYAKIFKVDTDAVLDLTAINYFAVLGTGKLGCILQGCCTGIYIESLGTYFPSAIAETVTAYAMFVVLYFLFIKGKFKGYYFPIVFVLYGVSRYIYDLLRYERLLKFMNTTLGVVSSIALVVIGAVWFAIIYFNSKKKKNEVSSETISSK